MKKFKIKIPKKYRKVFKEQNSFLINKKLNILQKKEVDKRLIKWQRRKRRKEDKQDKRKFIFYFYFLFYFSIKN